MAEAVERLERLQAEGKLSCPELYATAVVEQVQTLLDDAAVTGCKVAAWDQIQELLLAAAIAWKARYPPNFVGVHAENRSKHGVVAADAHKHGEQIVIVGFSFRKAADATAVEHDENDNVQVKFNRSLVEFSDNMIPELTQLKIISIGASHTNVFLRALRARSRTCIQSLQDACGKLDTDAISARPGGATLRDAYENGLHWLVLHRDVGKVWPTLIDTVQKALNTETAGGQSELEVMLSMHNMFVQALEAKTTPDWQHIAKAASFSMPSCQPYIDVLAAYVQRCAGDGELLRELSDFQKTLAEGAQQSAKRVLGSLFIGKVSQMSFGAGIKCPFVQNALLKANLASPKNKVVDSLCQLITPAHVAQLTSKKLLKSTIEIDSIMQQARTLVQSSCHALQRDVVTKTLGQLDVRLVTHLLKLGKQIESSPFNDVGEILHAFLHTLSASAGFAIESPWSVAGSKPAASAATSSDNAAPQTIAQMKSMKFQAGKLGFVENAMVSIKKSDAKDERIWKVSEISDLEVKLVLQECGSDASDTKTVEIHAFLNDWKLNKARQTYKVQGWGPDKATPMQCFAWLLDGAKGAAALAMQNVWTQHSQLLEHVDVWACPTSVQVTKDFKAGELTLVGASQRIDRTEPSKGVYFKLCEFEVPGNSPIQLFLSSHFVAPINATGAEAKSPWVAPFWSVVASSADQERAAAELGNKPAKPTVNMTLKYVAVTMGKMVVQVPTMQNHTAVKAGTTLYWNTTQSKEPTSKRQKKS